MTESETLTEVGGTFCASHHSPEGQLHGHSYEVWAGWHGGDARDHMASLTAVLALYDHTHLPPKLAWGEPLAKAIGEALPGCVEVLVARPLERIRARWRLTLNTNGE